MTPALLSGEAGRRGFLGYLEKVARASVGADRILAMVLDYPGTDVADRVRRGELRIPLAKLPALAPALGLDANVLTSLWITDYALPDSEPVADQAGLAEPGTRSARERPDPWPPPVVAPWGTELQGIDPHRSAALPHRFKEGSLLAIARVAKQRGITQKQLVSQALVAFGVPIMHVGLEDRTPIRRWRRDEV